MNNLRGKMAGMMAGRYGVDDLGKTMLYISLGLMIISMFVRYGFIYILALALLIICYIRMFSRNVAKRYQENQKYVQLRYKVTSRFANWKKNMAGRKTHHIYKCPSCSQKVRVPKGKGRIEICCPKCAAKFVKKS